MGIVMFAFRRQLIGCFTHETIIIELGASVMILAAINQPFSSSFQIYSGALRGAGDSLYPALSMAIGTLGIRPLLAVIMIKFFSLGLFGAWIALMTDVIARFFLIAIRYRRGRWVHITV
jgi:Na+-driven multidrug efflux pump